MLTSMTPEALKLLRLHGTSELALAANSELQRRAEALKPKAKEPQVPAPEEPGASPEDFAS